MAVIVLSSDKNTKIWRPFPSDIGEELENREEMLEYVNNLDYSKLNEGPQDNTYTGKAFKIAYEKVSIYE